MEQNSNNNINSLIRKTVPAIYCYTSLTYHNNENLVIYDETKNISD